MLSQQTSDMQASEMVVKLCRSQAGKWAEENRADGGRSAVTQQALHAKTPLEALEHQPFTCLGANAYRRHSEHSHITRVT